MLPLKSYRSLWTAAESQVGEELWRINGPKIVELQALADDTALQRVTAEIERFAQPVGLNKTLGDLVEVLFKTICRRRWFAW